MNEQQAAPSALPSPSRAPRQPYAAPRVEPVGAWSTATLLLGVSLAPGSIPNLGSLFQHTDD